MMNLKNNFWTNWHWFGRLNFFLLQFLFIRLTKNKVKVIDSINITSIGITKWGDYSPEGLVKAWHTETWWSIQYWILPFTGWWGKYIWIGGGHIKRITKNKHEGINCKV